MESIRIIGGPKGIYYLQDRENIWGIFCIWGETREYLHLCTLRNITGLFDDRLESPA